MLFGINDISAFTIIAGNGMGELSLQACAWCSEAG